MSVVTPRAVALSLVAVLAGSWMLQRIELVFAGPALAAGPLPSLPVLLLVTLAALRQIGSRWLRLQAGELLGCYTITAVGLPLATTGFTHYLLPGLVTGFFQFADPSGRYHPFLRLIPEWAVPGREGSAAVTGFFEGGGEVPWSSWLWPLASWTTLVIAFVAASWGLMTLLRRRWLVEERLRAPLAELPMTFLAHGEVVLRNRVLWAGVLVPILLYGVNGLHHYLISPAEIPLSFDMADVLVDEPWSSLAPYTSRFEFAVSPLLVGIAYLMSVEVAFSTWFFYLLSRVQLLLTEVSGRTGDPGEFIGLGGQWREWPNFVPHLQAQARGGLLCLALLSLWSARRALAAAWRRAVAGSRPELGGFAALTVGAAALLLWSTAAGLSAALAAVFVLLLLVTMLGAARLRLDGGLPVVGIYFLIPNLFYFVAGTGPGVFQPSEYVALSLLSVFSYTGIAVVAMIQVEGWKMAETLRLDAARVGLAVSIGVAAGLACGFGFMLELVYDAGIFTLDRHGGARSAARIGRYYHYLYSEAGTRAAGTDLIRLAAMAVGFAATWVLAIARTLFVRMPFHPAGFIYGTGFGYMIWGSALLGWIVKVLVVRYGGAASYRSIRPFFIGLILGDLFMRFLWGAVAMFGEAGGGYGM